ncbi:MAG: hypothetical protein ACK8QZ_02850, partial [Anaerolineales bacterium]
VRLILESSGANGQRLRKEALLDGVKKSLSQIIGHFNAVLFAPHMTQIIEGGPEERRRFLNLALAQVIPSYAATLSEYVHLLEQRNALEPVGGGAEREGEARRDMDEAAAVVGLPQPVGRG